MSNYNDGSTYDRDDQALLPDTTAGATGDDSAESSPSSADDVGETTPALADTTVGAVDAADAEFNASADDAGEADAGSADEEPSEPVDRFDDNGPMSGPELTNVPSTLQPGTQDDDPLYAELDEDGQGDLAPEDQI